MKRYTIAMLVLIGTGSVAGLSLAQSQTSYLQAGPRPDLMKILPPPPARGSPGDQDDRATFRETRKLRGTDRWALATADVTQGSFKTFACAMGLELDATRAPAMARVLDRMGGGVIVDPVKKAMPSAVPTSTSDCRSASSRPRTSRATGTTPPATPPAAGPRR